ncbi:hypothetical protein H920_00318 [Fukomys damarensis]|uniref:Secreted protein n=1 Tax=Fukomys damarensis TaxID=885580 RepID=A0A091E1Q4_FUKDA|nr:hypothetical protein H920_00318 [Fukomys damarensis]
MWALLWVQGAPRWLRGLCCARPPTAVGPMHQLGHRSTQLGSCSPADDSSRNVWADSKAFVSPLSTNSSEAKAAGGVPKAHDDTLQRHPLLRRKRFMMRPFD